MHGHKSLKFTHVYINKQLNITNTHLDKHVLCSAEDSSGAFLSSTDPENNKII